MSTKDTCCSIAPYFDIQDDQLDAFKSLAKEFVAKTKNEEGCLYYCFSFNGLEAHCREGYKDANALLVHLDNVGKLLEQALQISELSGLEIHGPEAELAKLQEPLADLPAQYFALEDGFRR